MNTTVEQDKATRALEPEMVPLESVPTDVSEPFKVKIEFESGGLENHRPAFVKKEFYNMIPDVVGGAVFTVQKKVQFKLEIELGNQVRFNRRPSLIDPRPSTCDARPIKFGEFEGRQSVTLTWTGEGLPSKGWARFIYRLPIIKDEKESRILLPFVFMPRDASEEIQRRLKSLGHRTPSVFSLSGSAPPRVDPEPKLKLPDLPIQILVEDDKECRYKGIFDYDDIETLPPHVQVDPFFVIKKRSSRVSKTLDFDFKFTFAPGCEDWFFEFASPELSEIDHPKLDPSKRRLAILWKRVTEKKRDQGCITPKSFRGSLVSQNQESARIRWEALSVQRKRFLRVASFFLRLTNGPQGEHNILFDPTVVEDNEIPPDDPFCDR